MTTQDDISQVPSDRRGSNMFENKSDSEGRTMEKKEQSRRNDGEVKSNCTTDNLSITFEEDKSIIDVPNTKLQTCQLSSSESRLSYDNESLRNSLSQYTSASLPAIPSSDSYLVRNKANAFEKNRHTQGNVGTPCADEEETLFNRLSEIKDPQCSVNKRIIKACQSDPTEDEHEKDYPKERITESGMSVAKQFCEETTTNSQLQINDKITNERSQVAVDVCKKNGSNSTAALNNNARGSMPRRTLADDSKLVKMWKYSF